MVNKMMRMAVMMGCTLMAALTAPARATDLLSIPGLASLAAEKAKEGKACGLVNFEGEVAAGAYLPVWTFHGKYESGQDGKPVRDPMRDYLEFGLGGAIKQGENMRPLLTIDANLPALSGRLWSSEWSRAHLRRTVFPPMWFGPQVKMPLPGDRFRWDDWRDWLGFIVSVGF